MLAVPGLAPLLGISLLARAAITADVMALTMYVVLSLGMSYAAAGGVAAALTAGMALSGQLLDRTIDRRGPRTVLLLTAVLQAVFWLSVPVLPYGILLDAAFAAGLLMVPAQLVTRQAIAAMTTAGRRRAAFALESVQGELLSLTRARSAGRGGAGYVVRDDNDGRPATEACAQTSDQRPPV